MNIYVIILLFSLFGVYTQESGDLPVETGDIPAAEAQDPATTGSGQAEAAETAEKEAPAEAAKPLPLFGQKPEEKKPEEQKPAEQKPDEPDPNILILEDASHPAPERWQMIGPNVKGSGVWYVSNESVRKRVIQLKGFGLKNVFVFKNKDGDFFDLKGYRAIQWKMKFSEPFIVQVLVTTSKGKKYLVYSDLENKASTDDIYLHFGLGSHYRNGKWHTVTRDLVADLHSILPETKIEAIHGVFYRGSGYVDDIWALKQKPRDIIVEDGEMHGLEGWDSIGSGGLIDLDTDPQLGSIIRFDSGEKNIPFRLRKPDGKYWKVRTNVVIQWKMKMQSSYKIYIIGDSTEGKILFAYDDENISKLYDHQSGMIHYGLGADTVDNKWRVITRDLSEDIKRAMPGADVTAVSSIIIRGKGWIDDIKLLAEPPSSNDIASGWDIFDNQPGGAAIRIVSDLAKGNVVEFAGDSVQNGYRFSGRDGNLSSEGRPFFELGFAFVQAFDFMVLVETGTAAKYIHYVPEPENYVKTEDGELFIGIGKTMADGRWHSISRDLSEDIKKLGDKHEYISARNFLVRGSGRIEKIEFNETRPKLTPRATPSAVASIVIGQFDFLHILKNLWDISRGSVNSLHSPAALTVDEDGGIYVADTGNGRIMYWSKVPRLNGSRPNVLLAPKWLKYPSGVATTKDYVVVADMGNDSIFLIKKPMSDSSVPVLRISGFLKRPNGLFYDGTRIFAADTGNHRVLCWNTLPSPEKKEPDLILGQSSLSDIKPNQGKEAPTFNTMNSPSAIYSDGTSLYIADSGNNRVLYYKQIPTMNGWHANFVLGQEKGSGNRPNMGKEQITDKTLYQPSGVFGSGNKIFVSDSMNNRVMIFIGAIDENAKSADGVLGQVVFSTGYVNMATIPGSDTLFLPQQGAAHKGVIYVTDTSNHRVLIY
ncbi:MAG: NHL repeat-containing protein [Oligoflexia bacterium]|nr:NHL repeat-containing protein [Oligoflexia bacterium]